MTIKSFQGLGLVNHNIPPPPKKKKKIVNCRKTSKKELIISSCKVDKETLTEVIVSWQLLEY